MRQFTKKAFAKKFASWERERERERERDRLCHFCLLKWLSLRRNVYFVSQNREAKGARNNSFIPLFNVECNLSSNVCCFCRLKSMKVHVESNFNKASRSFLFFHSFPGDTESMEMYIIIISSFSSVADIYIIQKGDRVIVVSTLSNTPKFTCNAFSLTFLLHELHSLFIFIRELKICVKILIEKREKEKKRENLVRRNAKELEKKEKRKRNCMKQFSCVIKLNVIVRAKLVFQKLQRKFNSLSPFKRIVANYGRIRYSSNWTNVPGGMRVNSIPTVELNKPSGNRGKESSVAYAFVKITVLSQISHARIDRFGWERKIIIFFFFSLCG